MTLCTSTRWVAIGSGHSRWDASCFFCLIPFPPPCRHASWGVLVSVKGGFVQPGCFLGGFWWVGSGGEVGLGCCCWGDLRKEELLGWNLLKWRR